MSTSEIQRFTADLKSDAALRMEAEAYGTGRSMSPEDVIAFAAAKGYDFTAAELAEVGAAIRSGEISDAELDGISGGSDSGQKGDPYGVAMHLAIGFMTWAFTPNHPSR